MRTRARLRNIRAPGSQTNLLTAGRGCLVAPGGKHHPVKGITSTSRGPRRAIMLALVGTAMLRSASGNLPLSDSDEVLGTHCRSWVKSRQRWWSGWRAEADPVAIVVGDDRRQRNQISPDPSVRGFERDPPRHDPPNRFDR